MAPTSYQEKAIHEDADLVFYFTVQLPPGGADEELFAVAQESKELIREDLSRMVPALFGSQVRLRRVDVTRGSVTFWVVVGGAYTLISHYDDFVRSLERFISAVQDLLRRAFSNFPNIAIHSGYLPLEGGKRRRAVQFEVSRDLVTLLLVSYLILSHAVLLAVFLRILLKLLVVR